MPRLSARLSVCLSVPPLCISPFRHYAPLLHFDPSRAPSCAYALSDWQENSDVFGETVKADIEVKAALRCEGEGDGGGAEAAGEDGGEGKPEVSEVSPVSATLPKDDAEAAGEDEAAASGSAEPTGEDQVRPRTNPI